MWTEECSPRKMKKVQNIVLFLSIILCIGLVYISFFNVYQTDDYIWSYNTRRLGFAESFKETYLNWGGRYSGYGLSMLNPVFYDENGIVPKVYPLFLIFSFIGVSALNFKAYFNNSSGEALKKAFLLFFFYTVLLISLPEHYFWITGSNIYFLPVILAGLLLYFLKKKEDTGKKIWFYLSVLLIAVLMGSNEILALILEGLLLLACYRKRDRQNLLFLLAGSIFLLVNLLAPGNFNRMGEVEYGIVKWLKRIGVFGANTVYIAIKSLLLLPLFLKIFEKELTRIRNTITFREALLFWGVSLIPLLFTGYILNTIARQFESILLYFFAMLSVLLIFKLENIKKFWWAALLIIFLPELKVFPEKYISFNLDFNIDNIALEVLTTDLKEYQREMDERIELIKNSSEDSIVVDKIKVVPRVLYFGEMASVHEEETFVNDQLQKYFNKKYIRTK